MSHIESSTKGNFNVRVASKDLADADVWIEPEATATAGGALISHNVSINRFQSTNSPTNRQLVVYY